MFAPEVGMTQADAGKTSFVLEEAVVTQKRSEPEHERLFRLRQMPSGVRREDAGQERLKLRDLLNEELPEEAALMKQAGVVSGLALDLQKHQLETTLRTRKPLTPEQRTKLMELRKNVRQQQRRRRQP